MDFPSIVEEHCDCEIAGAASGRLAPSVARC